MLTLIPIVYIFHFVRNPKLHARRSHLIPACDLASPSSSPWGFSSSSFLPFLSSKYSDSITILTISIVTDIITEAISYILIYRTASYKSLYSSILKSSKKLDLIKTPSSSATASSSSSHPNKKSTSKSKMIDRIKTTLKEFMHDLSLSKFKSGGIVTLVLFAVFGFLNSLFEGKVVAKLPFRPVAIVQKMSHCGLPGDDPTDCSMAFLYFLCSISIRTNLQKLLGFAPSLAGTGAGLFPMPNPKTS